ncbi:hypothetical protein ABZX12_18560 [Kribbella sp. NPDC003505]|uniref:hypothetical protein n=1 Tax=Kribbella sp. NPDC003505 TaxID=3154448 RepID=UPI0033BA1CFA
MTELILPPVAPARETHAPLDWRPEWGPAPRWATPRSPHRPTYGGELARLSRSLRLPFMPWQAYVHDVANEVDPQTGWWAYDEVVVTVVRQAGKTTLKIPLYAHRMQITPGGDLWMTAQNGKKAVTRWDKASMAMLNIPELNPYLKRWVTVARERLRWMPTGAQLVPFAPDDENMHGESPDLVDVDEWWAFDAVAAEGLVASYSPGFLTKNAQAWKTSTMGTEESAGLNEDVKKGRAAVEMDKRTGIAYFEWSLEDEPGGIPIEELSDDQLIAECIKIHPAIGFHPVAPADKMRHHIASELKTLGRREFIRAYGNRLQSSVGGWQVIAQPQWVAAMSDRPIPPGVPVGLGFEVDPDGRDAAIAVAWRAPDGRGLVEVVKVQDGATWVAADVAALCTRWGVVQVAVQNSGPARHVADSLIAGGMEVLRLSQMDFSAASALFHSEVTAKGMPKTRHIGQAVLNSAVEHVTKRRTGPSGAWAWRIDPSVSITALVAVTAALWAADHPRETEELGPFRVY